MITFEWDSREVQAAHGAVEPLRLFRALKRSGADAIRSMRAESKRQIRSSVRLRSRYLTNEAFPLNMPRARSSIGGLVWTMRVSGAPVPLSEYPHRANKKGVRVQVKRGSFVLIKSAFLARRKTGKVGVFLRPTEARYPMGHRLGLRVSDTFADGRLSTALHAYGQAQFAKRFAYWIAVKDLPLGK